MNDKRASLGKVTPPRVAGIVPRERLFALLDEARASPAVWVCGPPGSGKTTMVASYLERAKAASLWYQLDEGDADPSTFFYYLGLAAADFGGACAEPLPLLTPEYQRGQAVFARRFFQLLYARLPTPFIVVFDGYYELAPFSPIHEVMRDAIAELPPGGCAILVSRGDPPAAFARLRANRALAALGWNELRLTREETEAIAQQRRRKLAPERLDELYAKTQGWAAGLVLLLEQSKTAGVLGDVPDLASGQLVFDYLAGEIFEKSPAAAQELLLSTAYLPYVTPSLAVELTGNDAARHLIGELQRDNYFVSERAGQPEPVYQYHPMLREFLVARANDAYSKEKRRELQRRCAGLMEASGDREEALALFRDGRHWDDMARVLREHAEAMLGQGRGDALRRWIEDLPPEVQAGNPWLLYWAAASQAQLAPREARHLYARAYETFESREADRAGMVLAASGALDAILYEQDDYALMDRWMEILERAVKENVEFASPAAEARILCSMFTAATLREPHLRDTREWIARGLAAAQRADDPNVRMWVEALAVVALIWTGLYAKGWALIESMRRLAKSPGVTPFSLTTLKHVELEYYMLTADEAECLRAMGEGLEITRTTGVQTWLFQMINFGYGAALGCHDLDTAGRLSKQFDAQGRNASRFDLLFYRHFRAWEAMLRKDLMLALQEEKAALRAATEIGCPYFEVLCRLALAEILAECGDERKSIAHLRHLRAMVEKINNRHLEFTCLVVFARLALEHGRHSAGMTALRRGLALGREYGYTHFLWWRPDAMARVCACALAAGLEQGYVRDLIKRRGLVLDDPALSTEAWPWMFRLRAFGTFELLRNDAPLGTTGKAQKRPLEMLKVLIAAGGEKVSEARVIDAMWPRIDGDSAHRSFTSTLHRLRKLLGEDRAVTLHEGRLTLERRYIWLDAWDFDQLVDDIDARFRLARSALDASQVEKYGEQLLALYRGPLLANEDETWQSQPRERKRGRFVRAMGYVGGFWEERREYDRALACYERCLEADPLAEGFYRSLMLCYQRQQRLAEAHEAFNRCRKALAALDVEPSAETRAVYETVSQK